MYFLYIHYIYINNLGQFIAMIVSNNIIYTKLVGLEKSYKQWIN